MTRGLNGTRGGIRRLGHSPASVCSSCLRSARQASSSAAAAAAVEEPVPVPLKQKSPSVTTSTAPHQSYHVRAGVVLSRPPLITRELHPFEKAFFLYQKRLNERTALPFSRYFYYPKNTPEEVDWKEKIKQRQAAARDIGVYNGYRNDPWNDEVLVGAKESEPEHIVDTLVEDASTVKEVDDTASVEQAELEGLADKKSDQVIERPMPRTTEADKTGDLRSLNRLLARTLYLVVKGKDGWQFPSGMLENSEALHRAAERLMVQSAGINMNTWVVGNAPIGYLINNYSKTVMEEKGTNKIERIGEKTFFLKARIMAGQADIKGNGLGIQDYRWLAKDELEKELTPEYFSRVRNMLVEV